MYFEQKKFFGSTGQNDPQGPSLKIHKYVTETFRTDAILNPEYHRIFRVVPATTFLQNFASDRRHMRKEDGSWLKPPPTYPPITSPSSTHNLDDFISMDESSGFGEVLSLTDFVKKFHLR